MSKKIKIALLLLALAVRAAAQKPTIIMTPFPASGIVAPTASVCGFDILATPQAGKPNKEKLILFANTGIITGPQFVTLKNLATGKTVDENVSGSGHLTFSLTTTDVVLSGLAVIASPPFPADVATAAGLPQVALIDGRIAFTADLQGNILSIQSFAGTAQDVCQLLQ
jgi:hypothetical protein